MYPVLFHIGAFGVPTYTALVALGLASGAVILHLEARRRGLHTLRMLDAALAAASGGLVAARVVYVVVHWAYYQRYPHRALRVWDGGLSWHGALAGGVLAVAGYCVARRASPRTTLDVLTPAGALLAVCAWLGCFADRCAYGIETYPGQGLLWKLSLELPDLYGIRAPRVAVQLLGAGWSLAVLVVVLIAKRRPWSQGRLFPLWLTLYCTGAFLLGFVRADEAPWVAGWRAGQLADLTLGLIGLATLAVGPPARKGEA